MNAGKPITIFLGLLLLASTAHAARLNSEKHYQDIWCADNSGQTEFVLDDKTRADCLTLNTAVEVDFAGKWYECLGQAAHYAHKTGRLPACLLIFETAKDCKYLPRAATLFQRVAIYIPTHGWQRPILYTTGPAAGGCLEQLG